MKHTFVALIAVAALACTSCSHVQPTPEQKHELADCTKALGLEAIQHGAELYRALAAQDWIGAMQKLVVDFGPGIICEAKAILAVLTSGTAPTPNPAPSVTAFLVQEHPDVRAMQRARLEAWLDLHKSDLK